MDSSGLRVLFAAKDRADSNDHVLVIRNIPRQARRLLSVTGAESELLDA
jgi:anti-anti-sigma regulatory factor